MATKFATVIKWIEYHEQLIGSQEGGPESRRKEAHCQELGEGVAKHFPIMQSCSVLCKYYAQQNTDTHTHTHIQSL